MDRISDSGSDDLGSNPGGITCKSKSYKTKSCSSFLFDIPIETQIILENRFVFLLQLDTLN